MTTSYNAWMRTGFDFWMLGAEAGTVMTMRLAKLAMGAAGRKRRSRTDGVGKSARHDRVTDQNDDRRSWDHAFKQYARHPQTLSPESGGK